VGSLSLKHLKQLIGNILTRMDIANQAADEVDTDSADKKEQDAAGDRMEDLEDKIKQLENALDQLNRPASPNTVIDQTQSGSSPAKKDWEVTKLKKRVDANDEGIDRLNDLFEELSKKVGKVDDKVDQLGNSLENEQKEQDASIERLDRDLDQTRDKLAQINDRLDNDTANERMDQLQNEIDDLKSKSSDLSDSIGRCIGWDDLNETFNQEIIDTGAEKTFKDERQKYPNYFTGLESISNLREKLDKAIDDLNNTNQGLDSVKAKTDSSVNQDELNKDLDATNENLEKAEQTSGENKEAIGSLEDRLRELAGRNKELSDELDQYRRDTDRVGSANSDRNDLNYMNLHDELATIAESCLDLKRQVKGHTNQLGENASDRQSLHEKHDQLRTDFDNYVNQELARQRTMLDDNQQSTKVPANQEALERLQDALAGTEDELSKLHKLIEQLNAEGANKNKELEQLQQLLEQLQEQAAMRDFVLQNLDGKADKADFDRLMSRDDLDETAQAIIAQLQDLIAKQAQSEADLTTKIATVDDQLAQRTKDTDFNPFRDEIEQRLRQLRKKIENAKKEDLDSLTTAAGAAGFRRQLFNCISCDKSLNMRTGEPVLNLPAPAAFPTRVSLRPNMTYELEAARSHERGAPEYGQPRKDYSSATNYAQLVAEKELERRRKMQETKMRQEFNPYNFNSGKMPRAAGGAINPQRAAEAYYSAKERDQGLYQEANLEGTDGNLYRGRVEKLPDIKSHRVPSSKGTRTVPDGDVVEDVESTDRPNTSSDNAPTPPTDSEVPV